MPGSSRRRTGSRCNGDVENHYLRPLATGQGNPWFLFRGLPPGCRFRHRAPMGDSREENDDPVAMAQRLGSNSGADLDHE